MDVLVFGRKKTHAKCMFNDSEISIAIEYKYVGTVVSTKTKDIFGKTQDNLAHKSRNAIYALNLYVKNTTRIKKNNVRE